jgi:hypothetical protein
MQLTGEMGPVNAIDSRVGPTNGNDDWAFGDHANPDGTVSDSDTDDFHL